MNWSNYNIFYWNLLEKVVNSEFCSEHCVPINPSGNLKFTSLSSSRLDTKSNKLEIPLRIVWSSWRLIRQRTGSIYFSSHFFLYFPFSMKMEAFKTNKRIFAWLNIYPSSENPRPFIKCLRILNTALIILTEFLALVASALFIFKFVDRDLENCLYALFQVAALFSMIYMWIVAFCLRNSIADIFAQFQTFYDSSESISFRNSVPKNPIYSWHIFCRRRFDIDSVLD